MSDPLANESPARGSTAPQQQPASPLMTVVAGYIIGSLLHGGLDLSLISIDAATNDNRSTIVVEGKHSRQRLSISVREVHER